MERYSDLRARLSESGTLNRLTPVTSADADAIKQEWPGIPPDYLDFLVEIGYGTLGQDCYNIYGGPIRPDEVYDSQTATTLGDLLLSAMIIRDTVPRSLQRAAGPSLKWSRRMAV